MGYFPGRNHRYHVSLQTDLRSLVFYFIQWLLSLELRATPYEPCLEDMKFLDHGVIIVFKMSFF